MGSRPRGPSWGLCFHSAAGAPVVVPVGREQGWGASSSTRAPLPVAVLLSSSPACPGRLGGRRRPRRTPGPAISASRNGTRGCELGSDLTPGCRVTEAVGGSQSGLKAGVDASSCSADAEPGGRDQGSARPLRLLCRCGVGFGVV